MDKNKFFWIGGFSSLGSYAFFLLLLVYTLIDTQEIQKIAIKSENSAIEVSMEELEASIVAPAKPTPKPKEEKEQKQTPQKPSEQKPQPKPAEKATKEEPLSPKQLFEGLGKKEPKPEEKKPVETKKTQEKQAEQIPTQAPSAKDILSAMALKKNSEVSFASFNTSGETNEYLAKIAKLIKQGWTPSKADVGAAAIIAVSINGDGGFSFRVKNGSSADFNERLSAYLKMLQQKGFAPPPDKKSVAVEFNFKAKE